MTITPNYAPAKNQSALGDFLLICRYCIGGKQTHGKTCGHCDGVGDTKITWQEAAREYGAKFVAKMFKKAVEG